MRIPNILPMLALLFCFSLTAQNTTCEIYDLVVETGNCTSNSTYVVELDFKVANPGSDSFDLWGNNQHLGVYALTDLPLKIDDFPSIGLTGYVKVCIQGSPNCCRIKQFVAPNCTTIGGPCEIKNVVIKTGDCTPAGLYKLTLDFDVANPTNGFFELWAGNGQYLGHFPLSQLPLSIPFPWGGGAVDKIKICLNDSPDCCKEVEFPAPACFQPCRINDLRVETGDCTSDSTYEVRFKFQSQSFGSPVDSFDAWTSSGTYLGRFAYSDMPIVLTNFPWGGGTIDGIKVCTSNNCCREKEFNVPDCLAPSCGIDDVKVDVGGCTSPKSYKIQLNLAVNYPANIPVKVYVWADNGDSLGVFDPADFPLGLEVPWNGDAVDALKLCLIDAAGNELCCEIVEIKAPDCLGVSCGIFDLKVETGDCFSNGTYEVWINFQTPALSLQKFGVWTGAGKFLGFFSVADLPIYIKDFPAGGGSTDKIIVCFSNACCETKEFNAPDCAGQACGINDLKVETGPCASDSTYQLTINFNLATPAPAPNTQFMVYAANGDLIGTYAVGDLPVTIQDFPWNGNAVDAVKICIANSAGALCCRIAEFKAPDCLGDPCGIYNLSVVTGDCNDDGTYAIKINFQTTASFPGVFGVWAGNGNLLGIFTVSDLPLTIPNFPASGNDIDKVRICLIASNSTAPLCCRIKEFNAPDCSSNPCGLSDLTVKVGDCTSDKTYEVWIDFKLNNPDNTTLFAVYANGNLLGEYPLSALPLYIKDFPWNGGAKDVVKVCILSPLTVLCCETVEFGVPDCLQQSGPCEIYDMVLDPGGCTSDSTYKLFLNFKVQNPGQAAQFGVWANGEFLGFYALADLPLTINNFPWGGGNVDVVKVCVVTSNVPAGSVTCCRVKEFHVPDCLQKPCEIYDLKVETGDCDDDGDHYEVWLNFKVQNAPAQVTHFGVWANGQFLGFFQLNQLPLYIPDFPTDGGLNDVVKVCLSNAGAAGCCAVKEFQVPGCVQQQPCQIVNLKVETGDCNDNGTYEVWVNFQTSATTPAGVQFGVWANGQYLGSYPLSSLPLYIPNFPTNGGPNDVVKVCILGPTPNIPPACCAVREFKAPDCSSNGPCEIKDLTVKVGDCNDDGTYQVWIDFKSFPVTPMGLVFGVWANGTFLGTYSFADLPLHIEHFPASGGPGDAIKVCVLTPNALHPLCCFSKKFPAPDCTTDPCKIWDLQVMTTPCLCGQFFAVLTFNHQGGGGDGFDIVGNGVNYGNFAYNQPQPIILGPLDGDGATPYEFEVRDSQNPDCRSAADVGIVDCPPQFQALNTAGTGKIALAPNPASNWLSVTAQLNTGVVVGQATVEVRQADGRLVRSIVVPNGSNFQLDVSELQAGLYRLSLQTAEARLESTFAKQ